MSSVAPAPLPPLYQRVKEADLPAASPSAETQSTLWAREGTSPGLVFHQTTPCVAQRFLCTDGRSAVWLATPGSAPFMQSRLRLAQETARAVGRTLVHELNGKIMGVGCLVGEGMRTGRPHVVDVEDQKLLDQALGQLREASQFASLGLKPPIQGPAPISTGSLESMLQKLAILSGGTTRPARVCFESSGSPVPSWAAHSAIFWVSACARLAELPDFSQPPLEIRLSFNPNDYGGYLEVIVRSQALTGVLLGETGAGHATLALSDWIAFAPVRGENFKMSSDQATFRIADPIDGLQPLIQLVVGVDREPAPACTLNLPANSSLQVLALVILRHVGTLESIVCGNAVPRDVRERLQSISDACGIPLSLTAHE